jgi:hypothetical protein
MLEVKQLFFPEKMSLMIPQTYKAVSDHSVLQKTIFAECRIQTLTVAHSRGTLHCQVPDYAL